MKMSKKSIKKIPSVILSMVATYLSIKEIKSFRLVCRLFYNATMCKDVLKRLNVKARSTSSIFVNFMKGISGGKFVTLNLLSVKETSLSKILDSVPNVQNVAVNIKFLHLLKDKFNLCSLTLIDDNASLFDKMKQSDYEAFFRPTLSSLSLKSLKLKSFNQTYYSDLIQSLLSSVKTLHKIHFESLTINNTRNSKAFKDFILSCEHITSWTFCNVKISSKKGILLPFTTKQYTCVDSILSLINNQHSNLQSFTLASLIPYVDKIWKKSNFTELRYLELHNCFFYFTTLENSRKLNTLKLLKCHLPFYHLMKLSPHVQSSLKRLSIQTYKEIDDEKILTIIKTFVGLEEISIINMYTVTSKFLEKINHSKLKFVFIENCCQFNKKPVRDHIYTIKNALAFTVVFNDMVNGVSISLF